MKTMFKITIILLAFVLGSFTSSNAQCSISPSSLSIDVGETGTLTASSAQAYYWTVSGSAQIVGSNTGQSVTILATDQGSAQVCVTLFINGECYQCCTTVSCNGDCPITIIENIPMCFGQKANCWERRGHYRALDCNGNSAMVTWDISPKGTNGSCIYNGCNNPFSAPVTNTEIKPHPVCNWLGLKTTIYAYDPQTGDLLDSYVTTINSCPSGPIIGFREAQPNQENQPSLGLRILDNQPGGNKVIELEVQKEQSIVVSAVHLVSGKEVVLQANTVVQAGNFRLDFPKDKLEQGAVYLIVAKSGNDILGKTKLVNL